MHKDRKIKILGTKKPIITKVTNNKTTNIITKAIQILTTKVIKIITNKEVIRRITIITTIITSISFNKIRILMSLKMVVMIYTLQPNKKRGFPNRYLSGSLRKTTLFRDQI